jgi:hypothetical protein
MQIQFERTGGFANFHFTGNFDLNSLPAETASSLKALLEQVDFRSLPEQILGQSAIPDQMFYQVTVTTPAWRHSVYTDERNAPEPLRQLIQILNQLTRSQARKSQP